MKYATTHDIFIDERYIYIDEGISGRKAEKRPAFMRMIKEAKRKPRPYDVILVHKFDRFARNREDSVVYKSLLKQKCGIRVVSITEQLEDDKFSIILESMLEAMAEYYSLNLSDEVKKGMSEKARRGGMQTRPPLGYDYKLGKLVVNHKERIIIRQIYRAFVEEESSYVAIAKRLNAMGYRTKNKGMFQSKSIKYILENPFYIGVVRWNRHNRKGLLRDEKDWIIATGDHEHIISKKEYMEANRRIERLKRRKTSVHHSQFSHFLSGMVRCAHCHGTMVYKSNGGKYNYFRCRKSANGACNQKKMIRVDELETLIMNRLQHDFHHWIIEMQKRDGGNKKSYEHLSKGLERMKLKYENIKRAYIEGVDSLEEYSTNKEQLDKEEVSIREQMETCQQLQISAVTQDIHRLLQNKCCHMQEGNALLSSFIQEIQVDTSNRLITIIYYY